MSAKINFQPFPSLETFFWWLEIVRGKFFLRSWHIIRKWYFFDFRTYQHILIDLKFRPPPHPHHPPPRGGRVWVLGNPKHPKDSQVSPHDYGYSKWLVESYFSFLTFFWFFQLLVPELRFKTLKKLVIFSKSRYHFGDFQINQNMFVCPKIEKISKCFFFFFKSCRIPSELI